MTETNNHADLIARGQSVKNRNALPYRDLDKLAQELADALAALGDTVPREQYEVALTHWRGTERERDEARAERDAIAKREAQVREWANDPDNDTENIDKLLTILETN